MSTTNLDFYANLSTTITTSPYIEPYTTSSLIILIVLTVLLLSPLVLIFCCCIYGTLYNNIVNYDEQNCFGKFLLKMYRKFTDLGREIYIIEYNDIPEIASNISTRTVISDDRYEEVKEFFYLNKIIEKVDDNYDEWDDEYDECVICMEKMGEENIGGKSKVKLPCNHRFHERCISDWLIRENKTTCPICRNNLIVI
tara:strand:- start:111 stop:701 length:591 start_codon:yes stop_codon:yes gene_type:complete